MIDVTAINQGWRDTGRVRVRCPTCGWGVVAYSPDERVALDACKRHVETTGHRVVLSRTQEIELIVKADAGDDQH